MERGIYGLGGFLSLGRESCGCLRGISRLQGAHALGVQAVAINSGCREFLLGDLGKVSELSPFSLFCRGHFAGIPHFTPAAGS